MGIFYKGEIGIDKIAVFQTELEWIQNKQIREFAAKSIVMLPDYFFRVAASSTGKYHPSYALGDGGLVRHTKAAVSIAHDLLQLEMYSAVFEPKEKDIILAALILHDGKKHGDNGSQYTVADHPTVVANWLKTTEELHTMLSQDEMQILYDAIASHMGQWNTDYRTKKEILPKPQTEIQKFVHLCDYLASRKYLEFDFGDNYYAPNDQTSVVKGLVDQIVALCKEKIGKGCDKAMLYAVIAKHNNGDKNPLHIETMHIANEILKELQED